MLLTPYKPLTAHTLGKGGTIAVSPAQSRAEARLMLRDTKRRQHPVSLFLLLNILLTILINIDLINESNSIVLRLECRLREKASA